MKKLPLSLAADEIENEGTTLFCSYCGQEVPDHLQQENPCALCGEYATLNSAIDVSLSGRKLARPRDVGRTKQAAPAFAGYAPTRKSGGRRRSDTE